MCAIILKEEKEISSPKELKDIYPDIEIVLANGYEEIMEDYCLCQVDIDLTLDKAKIKYEYDHTKWIYIIK